MVPSVAVVTPFGIVIALPKVTLVPTPAVPRFKPEIRVPVVAPVASEILPSVAVVTVKTRISEL